MHKKANKRKERLLFNFITGVVIGVIDLVLLIIQQDKNLVQFLTTVHLCYRPHKWTSRLIVARDQSSMGHMARWNQADQTMG